MIGNKICVTRRGLQLIKDQRNQQPSKHSRTVHVPSNSDSLPNILPSHQNMELSRSRFSSTKSGMYGARQSQNNTLSKLSLTLNKYEKIGIKKLLIKKQDQKLSQILKEENKNREKYLQKIIPDIIRKTRDINKTNNLNSRYERSRSYAERLLQNYKSHAKFGMYNTNKKSKEDKEDQGKKKN